MTSFENIGVFDNSKLTLNLRKSLGDENSNIQPKRRLMPPERHEVMVDERDGLDWKTAVRCHQFVLVRKADLHNHRRAVSRRRRREIARKIYRGFPFADRVKPLREAAPPPE